MNIVKTIAILVIVGIGTYAVLLYAKPLPTQSEGKERIPVSAGIASTSAQTRLFYTPSSITLTSTTKTIPLMIQTGENMVSQVQVEFKYNPQKITIAAITPGDFFPEPLVVLSEIDEVRGRVNYAIRSASPSAEIKGGGSIIVLSVSSAESASASGTTQIEFLPKSSVRSERSLNSLLQSTENLLISLE